MSARFWIALRKLNNKLMARSSNSNKANIIQPRPRVGAGRAAGGTMIGGGGGGGADGGGGGIGELNGGVFSSIMRRS